MNDKTKFNSAILVLCACLFVQISCNGQRANISNTQMTRDSDKISTKNAEYAANELAEKLIHTESGIWVTKGFQNEIYYSYALQFSENYSVMFSYILSFESEYGIHWNRNAVRYGTFETNGNVLTINFASVKSSNYNKPEFSDEPIPESLRIKIEVEEIAESRIVVKEHRGKGFYLDNPDYISKDIEITEYTLIAKLVSGKNLFEIHDENTTIELVAERPIID